MEAVGLDAQPAKRVRKFYIFDRDDTLINKGENGEPSALINSDFVISFLRMIDREEDFQWAIASAGAIEWDADPVKAQVGNSVNKRPFYTQLTNAWSSVQNLISGVDGVEPAWTEKDKAYIDEQAALRKVSTDVVKAQIIFDMLSQQAELKFFTDIKVRWIETSFVLNSNIYFELKLGNTYLTIHAETFFKQRGLIQGGDNKLFCVLLAMDQAKLCVDEETKKKLATLGITRIVSGRGYQTISAEDVVFVDDKKGNCDLIEIAGFTAIQADTPPAFAADRCKTTNTYMEALNQTLPQDATFKHFVVETSSLLLKDTRSEIIVEKRERALELTRGLFENNDFSALQVLPQLAPLFNYKEFRFFSKSVDPICATPQLLAFADFYIRKNQYQKEVSDFLVLNLCRDWKRPEIQQTVAAIANIKPDGQITVSGTHFRMAYMAQYQCEFFTNPRSKMLQRIKKNPAEFDNIANIDITKENGRSKEVLTKLQPRA